MVPAQSERDTAPRSVRIGPATRRRRGCVCHHDTREQIVRQLTGVSAKGPRQESRSPPGCTSPRIVAILRVRWEPPSRNFPRVLPQMYRRAVGPVRIACWRIINQNRQGATVPVQSDLIAAIHGRRIIEFKDGGGYERIGEPHLVGLCAETGRWQLEFFQTAGDSSACSEPLPQWRRFTITDICYLRTMAAGFTPREGFDSRSPRWSLVIASVLDAGPA
jgi:hypothetical protein